MAVSERAAETPFDPSAYEALRFSARELSEDGVVTLRYALDDTLEFVERFELPQGTRVSADARARVEPLLALLHWVAGVSYFKTAVPGTVVCETGAPLPATAALLDALYSEGLGELAFTNRLPSLPRPAFPSAGTAAAQQPGLAAPRRVLVPVGGGKDSAVALEIVRRAGVEAALFSVGDAPPIARTAEVAALPRLVVRRQLDPQLADLNRRGALNGHVPITAIVTCVALLTAVLHGFDAVAMANERSASSGNVVWDGIEVNHQFSKSLRAERLLRAAVAEATADAQIFSVLRPASELAIARAFARMPQYHAAFTSCNTVFRLDPQLRGTSWCCDCPKCRFVYLVLAPFSTPEHLREVFGRDLLDEEEQFAGFALLTATGGHKPFECVGEEQESLAAIRLLAADPRWREHRVVRRLVAEVLSGADGLGDPATALALGDDHEVPPAFLPAVRALLGA
ncbi:MAG: endonuclease domain-containing protein [Conexibacter sp.]